MNARSISKLHSAPERYSIASNGGVGFEPGSAQKHYGIAPNRGVSLQVDISAEDNRVAANFTFDGQFAAKHHCVTSDLAAHDCRTPKNREFRDRFSGPNLDVAAKRNVVL